MTATLTITPNGTATGYVYRRRLERVTYPETPEAYAEEGFDPKWWKPDGVGFSARVVASITGLEERTELQMRRAWFVDSTDDTRADYYRELAWRVPEWNFSTENHEGEIVTVPAPGEGPDNWEGFDLLPYGVGAWLVERVRTIHLPKPKAWEAPPIVGTTATSIPMPTNPEPTPPSS